MFRKPNSEINTQTDKLWQDYTPIYSYSYVHVGWLSVLPYGENLSKEKTLKQIDKRNVISRRKR